MSNGSAEGSGPDEFDWDVVVSQIHDTTGTDTAVIDQYGIVLASKIKGLEKGRLISPLFWEIIQQRTQLANELEVNEIHNFVIGTDQGNIAFTLGKFIYLMTKIPETVNLAEYMPSLARMISTMDRSTDKSIDTEFHGLNLDAEYGTLNQHQGKAEDNFPVFKHLIKHLSGKKKKKKS